MTMQMSRRTLLKGVGAGVAVTSLGALGFAALEPAMASSVRAYKLSQTRETRNVCPYCSVACGVIMYSLGDRAKNSRPSVLHIEGDPDHPVNRGTLCPKGAGLIDFIHSDTRTKYPMYRAPGTGRAEARVVGFRAGPHRSPDEGRPGRRTSSPSPATPRSTAGSPPDFLGASATTNETAFLTYKVVRSTGALIFDNQARV